MLRPCCPMTKKVGRPVAHKSTYRRAQFPSRAARAICCHARADFHLRRVCVIGYDETPIARGIPPSQDCVLSRNYQCIIEAHEWTRSTRERRVYAWVSRMCVRGEDEWTDSRRCVCRWVRHATRAECATCIACRNQIYDRPPPHPARFVRPVSPYADFSIGTLRATGM